MSAGTIQALGGGGGTGVVEVGGAEELGAGLDGSAVVVDGLTVDVTVGSGATVV
jgi:hypothetical protein